MSTDDTDLGEWVTPAEALKLLWQPGRMFSHADRQRIIQRCQNGMLPARVAEIVRYSVAKSSETTNTEAVDSNVVIPLGQPLNAWELPLKRLTDTDCVLEEEDWGMPGLSDPNDGWWETGELVLTATDGSRARLCLYGIQFDRAAIERMVVPSRSDAQTEHAQQTSPRAPAPTTGLPEPKLRAAVIAYLADNDPLPDVTRKVWPDLQKAHPDYALSRDRTIAMVDEVLKAPRKQGPRS